ncbi:reverse transcriptase domain-containing protein [Tanacetum coccineum]
MCDASDYAIGAVLGQRIEKHFRPIHYASKTMTEAETNYTTTEKEMLAVVYAFEKFRSYLIMNKSVVYTDHSALKYTFQQEMKPSKIASMGLTSSQEEKNKEATRIPKIKDTESSMLVITSFFSDSRLRFSRESSVRLGGPFTITEVYPYGTAKLSHADGSNFKVNCHRLKHYYGGDAPPLVIQDLQTFPKDN